MVSPVAPVVFSNSSSRAGSSLSGSGFISQAVISASVAPLKQRSQTPKSPYDISGGPKVRQITGRNS